MLEILSKISGILIPVIIFAVVAYGVSKGQPVYDDFVEGAMDGVKTVVKIMPTLVGLMVAVGVLRASGFLDFLGLACSKLLGSIGFPAEAVPVTIVKMFSSSAATGLALDVFKEHGTDSFLGKFVSISMSSTETIFYTMSVYFMTVKVSKTRYTLAGALIATFAGLVASYLLAGL
ncbi:MAG: spore maturation protein [Lachnospiraceae bacterium]|nr:spore maturation protein [Lachnospiraceae bacterium]